LRQEIDVCTHAMRDRQAEAEPALIAFDRFSSTESVDKSVHKWFIEMSLWLFAMETSVCPRKQHASKYLIPLLVFSRA
jgi:hypothetical protein